MSEAGIRAITSSTPAAAARNGLKLNQDGIRRSAFELLAFPDIDIARLATIWPEIGSIPRKIAEQVHTDAQYAVFLARQQADIEATRRDEALELPADLDYGTVTPAALTRLLGFVRRTPRVARDAA